MGKRKNLLDSEELRLSVAPEMLADLASLVRSTRGRYGKNPTEAAERLVAERLMDLAREGIFLPGPSSPSRAEAPS